MHQRFPDDPLIEDELAECERLRVANEELEVRCRDLEGALREMYGSRVALEEELKLLREAYRKARTQLGVTYE
jgi:predicted nuclease with TOPRIM domain